MYPKLTIDLNKLEQNSRLLTGLCLAKGVQPVGVTKATCGDPQVAGAMLAGGISVLAESRLENARRLRAGGIDAPLMLLRLPMPSQAEAVIQHFQYSLNSELEAIGALDAASAKVGTVHKIILMVDLGDLREGMLPEELEAAVSTISAFQHVRLVGLGVNLTCYGGIIPTPENLGQLIELNRRAQRVYPHPLPIISGGNSSSLPLLLDGSLPAITQLRLGESILLGRETVARKPLPGAHLDCFKIYAEVIEIKNKPTAPIGTIGEDAFGGIPVFKDRGIRRRAILALGRQDVAAADLDPPSGVEVLGASSDHLLLDVEEYPKPLAVGDSLAFGLRYGSLLAAMTSPYVTKEYR